MIGLVFWVLGLLGVIQAKLEMVTVTRQDEVLKEAHPSLAPNRTDSYVGHLFWFFGSAHYALQLSSFCH